MGRRQLVEARCACVKERKASQCDCEQCTQVTLSLGRFNKSRAGWHAAYASTKEGKGCTCPLHDCSSEAAAAAVAEAAAAQAMSETAVRGADAEVWQAHAPSSQAAARAAAVAAEADAAAAAAVAASKAAVEKLAAAKLRIQRYAAMSKSEEALMVTLLPCGRREFQEHTVTGERTFKCYLRACCEGNCPNRGNLFERRKGAACGYELVFEGYVCPVDNSDNEFIWSRWEKMLRNENKDRETADGKQARRPTPRAAPCLAPPHTLHCTHCTNPHLRRSRATRWSSCRTTAHAASSWRRRSAAGGRSASGYLTSVAFAGVDRRAGSLMITSGAREWHRRPMLGLSAPPLARLPSFAPRRQPRGWPHCVLSQPATRG